MSAEARWKWLHAAVLGRDLVGKLDEVDLGEATRNQEGRCYWVQEAGEQLIPDEWVARWSGHSARHCLPSWSAALGVPAEQRAFVGRWKGWLGD